MSSVSEPRRSAGHEALDMNATRASHPQDSERGSESEVDREPEGEFDRALCFTFNALIRVNLCNPWLISSELLRLKSEEVAQRSTTPNRVNSATAGEIPSGCPTMTRRARTASVGAHSR